MRPTIVEDNRTTPAARRNQLRAERGRYASSAEGKRAPEQECSLSPAYCRRADCIAMRVRCVRCAEFSSSKKNRQRIYADGVANHEHNDDPRSPDRGS